MKIITNGGLSDTQIEMYDQVDIYGNLDVHGITTFYETPVVTNGSYSVELATKDDLANAGGYAEIIDLLD